MTSCCFSISDCAVFLQQLSMPYRWASETICLHTVNKHGGILNLMKCTFTALTVRSTKDIACILRARASAFCLRRCLPARQLRAHVRTTGTSSGLHTSSGCCCSTIQFNSVYLYSPIFTNYNLRQRFSLKHS